MDRLARLLGELGVPDRYGLISGIRAKVAELLVTRAKELGPERFSVLGKQFLEAVLEEVNKP